MRPIFGRAVLNRYYTLRGIGWLIDNVILFLLPLLAYRMTASVVWSSAVVAIQWTPQLAVLPIGGLIADRRTDRGWYLFNETVRLVVGVLVCVISVLDPAATRVALLTFAVAAGVTAEQILVVGEKLAVRLVPVKRTASTQSVLSGIEQVSLLAAPAVGGGLLWAGSRMIAVVCTGLCAASCALVATMPRPPAHTTTPSRTGGYSVFRAGVSGLVGGAKTVVSNRVLCYVIALTMVVNLGLGAIQSLTPGIVMGRFGATAQAVSVIYTIRGAGRRRGDDRSVPGDRPVRVIPYWRRRRSGDGGCG